MKILMSTLYITATLLLTTSWQVLAVDGLSANIGATNNYLWRGLEQTNGDAAISGGIDYETKSGFYLGTWVSNADWAENMSYELDIYGGYSSSFNDINYSVGFIYYGYPDSTPDVDFTELNASIGFNIFTFTYNVLADAEGADFADDSYLSIDADFSVASDIEMNLHVGRGTDDFYAGESFTHYGVSLSKAGFTFGLSNTDLDNDDLKVFVAYSLSIDL